MTDTRPPTRAAVQTATVTLARQHPSDIQQRQIYARLDDGPTHTLVFGDAVAVPVTPGTHLLRVNNTLFWKSRTFAVQPGEQIEFVLINRAGWFSFGFLALLGAAPLLLSIERR